jgi:hypothetical protein
MSLMTLLSRDVKLRGPSAFDRLNLAPPNAAWNLMTASRAALHAEVVE